MNWKAFFAMLARDAPRRPPHFVALLFQDFAALMFVFIFGTYGRERLLRPPTRACCLPGIMPFAWWDGIWAVPCRSSPNFTCTREIEDACSPALSLVAVRKSSPARSKRGCWPFRRVAAPPPGVDSTFPILCSLRWWRFSCALLRDWWPRPRLQHAADHIGLMFSLIVAPMIFSAAPTIRGAAHKFPILQRAVLAIPLVYASEGLRATIFPSFRISSACVVVGLVFSTLAACTGLRTSTASSSPKF